MCARTQPNVWENSKHLQWANFPTADEKTRFSALDVSFVLELVPFGLISCALPQINIHLRINQFAFAQVADCKSENDETRTEKWLKDWNIPNFVCDDIKSIAKLSDFSQQRISFEPSCEIYWDGKIIDCVGHRQRAPTLYIIKKWNGEFPVRLFYFPYCRHIGRPRREEQKLSPPLDGDAGRVRIFCSPNLSHVFVSAEGKTSFPASSLSAMLLCVLLVGSIRTCSRTFSRFSLSGSTLTIEFMEIKVSEYYSPFT